MEKLISVIVPVYNTGPYLRECVESILNQTYRNIELILVDDGSSDDSPSICDAYAESDSRVKVIHQDNGGALNARGAGVQIATGEYVTFVDADDSIECNAVEILSELAGEGIDIVISEESFAKDMTAEEYSNWLLCWHSVTMWGKLYKKSIVEALDNYNLPRSITVAEDFLFNLRILSRLSGFVQVSCSKFYRYRQLENSIIHRFRITPEYDALILSYALPAINAVPFDVRYGSAMYQIGILEHFIYNDFKPDSAWVNSLRELSSEVSLPIYQRLVLFSADRRWMKGVVKVFSVVKKGYKLIKRKMRWGL